MIEDRLTQPLSFFLISSPSRVNFLALAGVFCMAGAQAQTTALTPGAEIGNVVKTGSAAETVVSTAELVPKRTWMLVPRLSVTETLTDNVFLRNTDKQSDQITEISPGIRISGESARLKAYFDYSIREFLYAQNSGRNNSQNALNTFGTLEAVERFLFLDFSGVVAQQSISAFGVQSASNASVNANQTETASFRLSPYLKGRLAGWADYELRYAGSTMRSGSGSTSDVDQSEWTAKINGADLLLQLPWAVAFTKQKFDYSYGKQVEANRLQGRLAFRLSDTLRLPILAGWEENNYVSSNLEKNNNYGFGLEWVPSARTKVIFEREKRFFGNGHHLGIEHRTPLTAFIFSDVRDVLVTPSQMVGGSVGNMYDLMFAQMASVEPDPVQRAALVNNFLQANGISPNTTSTSGFFNAGPTVQRRQDISFALIGVRNTLTVAATQSETQRLGLVSAGDLATATAIRQRGYSISFVHRLSALTSINLLGSHQNSAANSTGQESSVRQLNASLTSKLGSHTSLSVGMRRAQFRSQTNPYTENAFLGTLNLQY